MAGQSVQIKLVLGHSAQWRKKPTQEGYTHDWTVIVKGEEGHEIKHFVDKVIFYLHESFPKPKRVFKDPPYQVSESGYGSFNLPVEVYFRNKDEPKKVKFDYDLLLPNLNDPPINQIRSECLTFQNPSEEFRQKLLKAGGVVSNGPPAAVNEKSKPPLPVTTLAPSNNSIQSGAAIAGGGGAAAPTAPPPAPKLKRSGSSLEGEPVPKKKKKAEGKEGKTKEKKKRNSSSSESSESDSSSDGSNSTNEEESAAVVTKIPKNTKKSSPNNWDTPALKRLHKQLNSLQDPQQLQEIVNIIEQTGLYNLTASTFDFDLCKLDDQTLSKLSKFVEPTPSSTSSF